MEIELDGAVLRAAASGVADGSSGAGEDVMAILSGAREAAGGGAVEEGGNGGVAASRRRVRQATSLATKLLEKEKKLDEVSHKLQAAEEARSEAELSAARAERDLASVAQPSKLVLEQLRKTETQAATLKEEVNLERQRNGQLEEKLQQVPVPAPLPTHGYSAPHATPYHHQYHYRPAVDRACCEGGEGRP